MMSAKVSITSVSIGTGESYRWRGVTSPRPLLPNETCVKVSFGISHVPGNTDMAFATIDRAFETLRQQGDVRRYNIGILGSTPEVICEPGVKAVRAIHASGQTDNEFTLALRGKLLSLLGSADNQK